MEEMKRNKIKIPGYASQTKLSERETGLREDSAILLYSYISFHILKRKNVF